MKFIKCGMCGVEIAENEKCELASYQRTIGGERYVFCCVHCADEFEKRQKQHKKGKV